MSKSQNNVDLGVVKKPGNDIPLTKKQEELWLHYADNPMDFFTEQCYVRGSKGKRLFEPREYQSDMLDVVIENTHCAIVSPRQSGKCITRDAMVKVRIDGEEMEITIGDLHRIVAGA